MSDKRLRKNITTKDIECNCGCGFDTLSPALLDILQMIRDYYNKPLHVNSRNHSACRCEKHNAEVGGVPTSKHLPEKFSKVGRASDTEVEGISSVELYKFLDERFPNCLGLGLYDTFVHIDIRMDRAYRWKKRSKKL